VYPDSSKTPTVNWPAYISAPDRIEFYSKNNVFTIGLNGQMVDDLWTGQN
jgi:hypothetical protein